MEILSGNSDRRRALAALGDGEEIEVFCRGLQDDYELVRCADADTALAILNEQFNDLSVALISEDVACGDDFSFLRAVAQERCFDTIPVIIVSMGGLPVDMQSRCFQEGAVDIIELPCNMTIAKQRLSNAIKIRRSETFYDIGSMLRVLPSMIFLKDADGRYVFSTQYWHHLDMGDDPKWTIRGKTDVDIRKDRENALAAMEADKEIMRTGKGTSYVIEINADGIQDFIELIKEPVFDDKGNVTGIIALGNNVTESELMKRKLARYALKDALTGLGNRRAFSELVDAIPERDDFPIAVVSADCDYLKLVNDSFGHLVGDEYIHMAASVMRSTLPDGELVFRVGGDEFIGFIPNATTEQTEELVEAMRQKGELFRLGKIATAVSYGIAYIDGPESNIQAAINLADMRMYEEKASHKRSS